VLPAVGELGDRKPSQRGRDAARMVATEI